MERDKLVQTVADNIQRVMKSRGMNPASLAREAKVNPTGIYDIMSGKSRSPRLDTIHKIANALNVPVSYLFEARDEADVRNEIVDVFVQLPVQEKQRLLQTALAWLPASGSATA